MPREQDPEINFNWVMVTAVLPGASAEDVEKRVTKPLEDAIKGVADVRFVMSASRENISSILVRFYDINERTFDKRINDLRRDIQNKAKSELPPEAKEPRVMEITTSNGFPTAMVLVTGQAADELLRARSRQFKEDIERMTGVDQVFATGLRDPELQVEFDPVALANRGLTATDVSDNVAAWFRDTFAGKIETVADTAGEAERTAWLVRVVGQSADPDVLAQIPVSNANRREPVPLGQVAEVSRARAKGGSLASFQGKGAVILAVTKKSKTNTLQLVERLNTYIAQQNPRFVADGVQMQLLDDQTVPTRKAITTMEQNALQGLVLVLAICWLFLGTRIAILVGLGIPFSLAGTFAILHALGYTLNISVLLGVVIALGMLVDDAVVVVESIYYRMQRGEAVLDASVNAMREVFAPVTSSVATTLAAFLPLMLLPGIVGKFLCRHAGLANQPGRGLLDAAGAHDDSPPERRRRPPQHLARPLQSQLARQIFALAAVGDAPSEALTGGRCRPDAGCGGGGRCRHGAHPVLRLRSHPFVLRERRYARRRADRGDAGKCRKD
jgi:multidrug efflux pump subunit AcrB